MKIDDIKTGQRVATDYGQGTIIRVDTDPKNKPLVVELDTPHKSIRGNVGATRFFHLNQVKFL